MERTVTVFDAFGLGLFCVTGALKALDYGLGPVPAALMGMVTGIGGGMARDVLAGRVPAVFRGELYATPALAGAFVAVLGARLELPVVVVAAAGAGLCTSGGWSRCGDTGRPRNRPGPPASDASLAVQVLADRELEPVARQVVEGAQVRDAHLAGARRAPRR